MLTTGCYWRTGSQWPVGNQLLGGYNENCHAFDLNITKNSISLEAIRKFQIKTFLTANLITWVILIIVIRIGQTIQTGHRI